MALTRNSKTMAAREKALRLARAAQQREAALLDLAEEYFVLTDEADAVRESAKSKGAALVEAAKAKAAQLVADADIEAKARLEKAPEVVARMLATGATRADVAERLDLSVSTVRKIDVEKARPTVETSPAGQGSEEEQAAEVGAPVFDDGERFAQWQDRAEHDTSREPVPVG